MENVEILSYILAVFVGITMGLIGSGGSILSVPIFAYVVGVEPVLATAYSLFAVGTTALFGGIQKAQQKLVDFKKVVLFGIPTLITVFLTRKYVVNSLPDVIFSSSFFTLKKSVLIMVIFAIVMMAAALKMIKPIVETTSTEVNKTNYVTIIFIAILIGLTAGFVGAGGGFLIIPALLFYTKIPMKTAVGTSLFIVAIQSLIGFLGDFTNNTTMDWKLLIGFSSCSIIGVIIGNVLSKKIEGQKLKTGFGYFVLVMGIYIIIKEIFIK
jgi:hypothetical protein